MWAVLFDNSAVWFTVPALIGTGIFVIRMVMTAFGGHHGDAGLGHDFAGHIGGHGHAGGAGHEALHHGEKSNSSQTFELLSLQSIVGFLMGFGWGGLAGLKGAAWPWSTAVICGVICGVIMVYILAFTFRAIYALTSSGNIALGEAIGIEGEVYSNVPAAGQGFGKVKLVISSRQRLLNAITDHEQIDTNTRVRVVKVNENNTVTVARL